MVGRVKWWSKECKYGFIEVENEENLFVHLEENEQKVVEEEEKIAFDLKVKDASTFIINLQILNVTEAL